MKTQENEKVSLTKMKEWKKRKANHNNVHADKRLLIVETKFYLIYNAGSENKVSQI